MWGRAVFSKGCITILHGCDLVCACFDYGQNDRLICGHRHKTKESLSESSVVLSAELVDDAGFAKSELKHKKDFFSLFSLIFSVIASHLSRNLFKLEQIAGKLITLIVFPSEQKIKKNKS